MSNAHPLRILLAILVTVIALGSTATAQIEVAPTRVMLTMRERSREVNVSNTTNNPMEVDVRLGFKLITTDSIGAQGLDSVGTPEGRLKSCEEWLKIFPRRFTLPPHASRVVRVLVTIPDGVSDGEYWARLIVGGVPIAGALPVDGDSVEGIQTNLMMRLELDLPVIVRKGETSTGVTFGQLLLQKGKDETLGLLDLARTGNSAYRGTLTATLRSADGKDVATVQDQYTVEFSFRKALHFPSLPDGDYLLSIESQSVKKGSAIDAVIPAEPVRKDYAFTVDGSNITITRQD
jgi:P pilus assembly chaperone PapD